MNVLNMLIVLVCFGCQYLTSADDFNFVPQHREQYDCGRMAVFNFANILTNVEFDAIKNEIPIVDPRGSSLQSMSDCLSKIGIKHQVLWVKPRQIRELNFPAILRLRHRRNAYHYIVVIGYDISTDTYTLLDGERDHVVQEDGTKVRLESTGFVIVPFKMRLSPFPGFWLLTSAALSFALTSKIFLKVFD